MRKSQVVITAVSLLLVFTSCKKSDSNPTSNAKTVENLSGSYKVTAIKVGIGGITIDEFANLKDCEKDNIIKLNTDLTADYIDAGIACDPTDAATGTWSLSSNTDSLTVLGIPVFPTGLTGFIQTWDGKTLVLYGTPTISGQVVATTITLFKQ